MNLFPFETSLASQRNIREARQGFRPPNQTIAEARDSAKHLVVMHREQRTHHGILEPSGVFNWLRDSFDPQI
eukprot:5370584-Pyramimonas_sp.AAC.1